MGRTTRWTALLAAVGIVGALAACSGEDGQPGRSTATGGTYTEAVGSDPGNLNPLRAVRQSTNTVINFAYDTLVNLDEDGDVVPQLAEEWDVSADRVSFTIRDGVTCEDGSPLDAEGVAKTFEWIKNPKNSSSYIGSGLPSADYTVEADNAERTVTLTLSEPFGFLLTGAGLVPIVCPAGLEDPASLKQETNGTGPFVLTEYVPDDHVTMQVRKDYRWGPDGVGSDEPGFPAELVFRVVQNPTTAVNLFLSGDLTLVTPTGPDEARLERGDYFTLEAPSGPFEMFFNQRDGFPTADPAVRQSLTQGLALDSVAKVVTQGSGERATSLTVLNPNPCQSESTEGVLPEFDPDAAASALDQAGWTVGSDGVRAKGGEALSLDIAYSTGTPAIDAAMELVSQQWSDLGVEVSLRGQGANAFLQTLFGGSEWDVSFLNVQIGYPTEFVPFASGATPPKGQNFSAIDNADYTRLSADAARTAGADGCEFWSGAEKALFQSADVVPISNTLDTTYGNDVEFDEGVLSIAQPTSIRLYQ